MSDSEIPDSDTHQNKRQKLDDVPSNNETVLRNGVEIPKDSALFSSTQDLISDASNYLPSELIIKHNLASLPLTLQAHESLPIRTQFVINSIPLLENISTQILRLIGVGPYEETLAIITNEEQTAESLVYRDLVELFEQVKRLYSEDDPFLQVGHVISNVELFNRSNNTEIKMNLKELEEKIDSALRKTNLATFLLATLGSIEVGFFFLDESFLDVFCPIDNTGWINNTLKSLNNGSGDGIIRFNDQLSQLNAGKLLKAPAALFLELKTQAFISSLESGDRSKAEILEDIFPSDLDQTLLIRRNNSTSLTPVEVDFINRCKSRKETLLNNSPENDEDLTEQYDWLLFLKELFNYVSKNISYLVWGKKTRNSGLASMTIQPTIMPTSSIPNFNNYGSLTKEEIQKKLEEHKLKELALKERERISQLPAEKPKKRQRTKTITPTPAVNASSEQLQPTISNSSSGTIRNMLRRPWTPEEDKSLIEALKELGPHWSRILELYGAGGSKSEALKNRTQVQLKDKARNWKMSYLKNGTNVPDYLKKVTGVVERGDKATQARKKQRKKVQDERDRLLKERSDKQAKDTEDQNKETATVKESENKPVNETSETNATSAATDKAQVETQPETQPENQSETQPEVQTETKADAQNVAPAGSEPKAPVEATADPVNATAEKESIAVTSGISD